MIIARGCRLAATAVPRIDDPLPNGPVPPTQRFGRYIMPIQTPPGWIADQVGRASHAIGSDTTEQYWHRAPTAPTEPVICRIGVSDVFDALRRGLRDFGESRTDIVFLCLFYPLIGLLLWRIASGQGMIPLLFPLISGFALVGPFAAVWLNEMSRLRETRSDTRLIDAFHVVHSPSLGSILLLGLFLLGIFAVWLGMADLIYRETLGPDDPLSLNAFLHDTLYTDAGWTMIGVGVAVGFVFAAFVLATSVVSFPLLLDRKLGTAMAILTSLRAVRANPGPMALWGLIVAVSLVVGSLPLLLGLAVVMPILGHATWHLYRKLVDWEAAASPEGS